MLRHLFVGLIRAITPPPPFAVPASGVEFAADPSQSHARHVDSGVNTV